MARVAIPQFQNLVLRSEEFANAAWTKGTGITATDNTVDVTDPLGTNTASKIVYDGSGAAAGLILNQVVRTAQIGDVASVGLWVRVSSGTCNVRLTENASLLFATVAITSTGWTMVSSIAKAAAVGAGHDVDLYRDTGDNTARTLYVWGAQFTLANRLGLYAKTTAATVGGQIRNAVASRGAVAGRVAATGRVAP